MGPGWLATGKFGSKTKYLAKLGLSGPISGPETAKTENKNPKISGGRPVPRSTGVTRVGIPGLTVYRSNPFWDPGLSWDPRWYLLIQLPL